MDDECEECGAPMDEEEVEVGICFDCYNDKRMAQSSSVTSDECGYCGSGTDPDVICDSCFDNLGTA